MNMSADRATTIRMATRTLRRIDGVARALSRSRTWVINQALERYLDYEEWFAAEVRTALKQAESGDLVEHDAVLKSWERKRAAKMGARR